MIDTEPLLFRGSPTALLIFCFNCRCTERWGKLCSSAVWRQTRTRCTRVSRCTGISRARCSEACLSRPGSCSRRRSLNNNRQRQGRRTPPTNEDGRGEMRRPQKGKLRQRRRAATRSHAQPRAGALTSFHFRAAAARRHVHEIAAISARAGTDTALTRRCRCSAHWAGC